VIKFKCFGRYYIPLSNYVLLSLLYQYQCIGLYTGNLEDDVLLVK